MTKNEKYTEISSDAYYELCQLADEYRDKYKPIWGEGSTEKWWVVLFPAIHVATNKEFNIGAVSGLTFPQCDVSSLTVQLGSKFTFPSSQVAVDFGWEARDLLKAFYFPETTILMRTR